MISWQHGKTLWALVQPQRGFSRRLKYLADEERPHLVWLEGPYGSPPAFAEYDTVVFVADGVGVTAHLLAIRDLLFQYKSRTARTKSIMLFWEIANDGLQVWAKPWFDELLKLDKDYILQVNFFIAETDVAMDAEQWGTHERIRKFFGPGTLLNRLISTFNAGFSGHVMLSVSAQQYIRDEARTLATLKQPKEFSVELHISDFQIRRPWMPWSWLIPRRRLERC